MGGTKESLCTVCTDGDYAIICLPGDGCIKMYHCSRYNAHTL